MILGALEAGGTKMVCSVGNEQGHILDRAVMPTLTPDETLPGIAAYFGDKHIEALASPGFGPLDLNPNSSTYGYITTTPKPGWQNCPLTPYLREALKVPALIDTDVGAAALAEFEMGAGKDVNNLIYVTVGTGVGGGRHRERPAGPRAVHPEAGHIIVKPHPQDPNPEGFCPITAAVWRGWPKAPPSTSAGDLLQGAAPGTISAG